MAATAIGIQATRDLDELYRAHAAEVFRYAYAVLGNRADAEDVTQTTFVNALRALERGEQPRKPANWLITIAHNLIRQRFRQQQSRPREVELDREFATLEAEDDGPSIEDLVRALQRIPETQREALVLRELEGRSYKEIAAILGVSVTALETLIFRARRSLAEELENLVTCDRAELALSQQTDGRLGRKERKRLAAHLDECPGCARVATLGMKRRRAFKGLAVLPLPFSLTFFKGAPSASAAIGLPTIGGGAAAGDGRGGRGGGRDSQDRDRRRRRRGRGRRRLRGRAGVREPATPARPAQAVPAAWFQPSRSRRSSEPSRGREGHTGGGEEEASRHEDESRQETSSRDSHAGERGGEGSQRERTRADEEGAEAERQKRSGARSDERAARAEGQERSGAGPDEDRPEANKGEAGAQEGEAGRRQARACERQDCNSAGPLDPRVGAETKAKKTR